MILISIKICLKHDGLTRDARFLCKPRITIICFPKICCPFFSEILKIALKDCTKKKKINNNIFQKTRSDRKFSSEQLHPVSAITVDPIKIRSNFFPSNIFASRGRKKNSRETDGFSRNPTPRSLESASSRGEESRTDCVSNY